MDSAFQDIEAVRKKHGDEVDKIVQEAYGELRDASKKDSVLEAVSESGQVLWKHLQRLASVSGDAAEDILNNHPQLKEKVGGSTDQLKELGNRLGPQVKEEVDKTWSEINDVIKQGASLASADKIRKIVQEKIPQIQQMGEKAFDQGLEQLKPLLEKSPEVKKFVEENKDALKSGNISETVEKVKSAVSNGSTQDLEKYVQQYVPRRLSPTLPFLTTLY